MDGHPPAVRLRTYAYVYVRLAGQTQLPGNRMLLRELESELAMATFTVQFDTDNDAFTDAPRSEIARILRATAERILSNDGDITPSAPVPVRDLNGNIVGCWELVA